MPTFTPTTAYDPVDPRNTLQAVLIEYCQWFCDLDDNAETAVVRAGYPNFEGKLPLAAPVLTVYPQPGDHDVAFAYDDVIAGAIVEGSNTYLTRGVERVYPFHIDVWTSIGEVDPVTRLVTLPAGSGGIPVRNRLKDKVLTFFGLLRHNLPEGVVVQGVRGGIDQEPLGDDSRDLCLGRVYLEACVTVSYYQQIS